MTISLHNTRPGISLEYCGIFQQPRYSLEVSECWFRAVAAVSER